MPSTKASAVIELFVPLDRASTVSLHHQLERHLRHSIRSGQLAGGSTMPSSRALADRLGVARGVVVEAYEQLIAEGYLLSRLGSSTRVAEIPTPPTQPEPPTPIEAQVIDLRPGRPDVTEFPRETWSRAARRVLNEAPADRFTYLDGTGVPELRTALTDYLGRARGTVAHREDIIISTGFMQALHLLGSALVATGARSIAVEEPYDPSYRRALGASGLKVVPVPVDEDGLRVELAVEAGVDTVVVTPAHQFPTGAVLAPQRRSALLGWARDTGGLIVEDDYDAEFRYDRDPIGAMQGLDPEHVVYAGTASKSIAPGLRLGWLCAPRRLVAPLLTAKNDADHGSSALGQLLLADVITHGELDRHLRRMRKLYRGRRDAMLASLGQHLPEWRAMGASAGLHVMAQTPAGIDEAGLVVAAGEAGVLVYGSGRYYAAAGAPAGIVFGYAAVDERRISQALATLAGIVRSSTR